MKLVLALATASVAASVFTAAVSAQVSAPPRKPPVVSRPKPTTGGTNLPKRDSAQISSWRRYRFSLLSSEVMDSNIDRDKEDPVASNGFVAGAVARYQSAEIKPAVQLTYEIANHSYSHSEQYDRVSHNLSALLARKLMSGLTGELIGEVALKGSSEDRDVGNQYIVLPRLNYRIDPARRLRVYGAYRIRRYDVNADRDAFNRYAGSEIRSDVGKDARVEVGFRYETNSARAARRSYTRRTYHTSYTRSLGDNDEILTELKYRSQRYDKRPVEEDDDNPRHDHRFS
ncbi:MAG TPA: hypothetical protein VHM24_08850, partial [Gemmatimonadaceae bacterium]|nr:hypothetical protein [Gemmatimonadaceae bacterium]